MGALDRDVLNANEAFYRAFRDRNVLAMAVVWAEDTGVACVHPGMHAIQGRAAVLRSYATLLRHPDAPRIECVAPRVVVIGSAAFVTCLEAEEHRSPRLAATNVFTLQDGQWRLVLHQAGPLGPHPRPTSASASSSSSSSEPPDDMDPNKLN